MEAGRITTPMMTVATLTHIDGITYDPHGNPVDYQMLDYHHRRRVFPRRPQVQYRAGCGHAALVPRRPPRPPSRRAGHHAGSAAVRPVAAVHAGRARRSRSAAIEPMDSIELERRMLVTMPGGWRMGQIEAAQQPTTTYGEFKREILNEIARCLNMPYNIAACNSSSYNYSSGRLDHQTYYKAIRVAQAHLEAIILDHILNAWLAEAVKVYPDLSGVTEIPHQWCWDGHEHVDPQKEANARTTRLTNLTTTLTTEYARQGKDWETELRQRSKELALMKELGLQMAPPAPVRNDGEHQQD